MVTIRAFATRHPLASFVAITFGITWGGIFLVVGPGRLQLDEEHFFMLLLLGYPAMFAGPTVACLLLTGLIQGRAGYADLRDRLLRWRVGARWYAVALLAAPLVMLAVQVALSFASPAFRPRLFVEADWAALGGYSIAAGLMTAIFEELGWTGFALPTVLDRGRGVLAGGLIVGLLYATWNLPLIYLVEVSNTTPGALPTAFFLVAILFTWQPAYRVLLALVYERTTSLGVAMLMAASLIASWTSLNDQLAHTRTTLVVLYIALAVAWCGIAAVIVLAGRRHGTARRKDSGRRDVQPSLG